LQAQKIEAPQLQEEETPKPPVEVTKKKITPEDVLILNVLSDAQVSPDGRTVVYVRATLYKEDTKKPKSNIWIAELDEGGARVKDVRQFTSGPRTDFFPRWSPDGNKLAFLSDRIEDGKFQIYIMNREGGEALQLTEVRGEVGASVILPVAQSIAWSPNGEEVAFLMTDAETEEELNRKKEKDDAKEFEKNPKFTRIRTVNVVTKQVKTITTGDFQVWEFDWSKDGKRFAALVSDNPYEWSWYLAKLAVIDVESGDVETVYDPKPRQLARPLWSKDGKSIYFLSSLWSDRNAVAGDLFVISADEKGRQPTDLTRGYEGSITWMEWLSPNDLLLTSIENAEVCFSKMDVSKSPKSRMEKLWKGEVSLSTPWWHTFSLSPDEKMIALVREGLTTPPEVFLGKISQSEQGIEWAKLTNSNEKMHELDIGEGKVIEWKSFDGMRMQGFLILPPRIKEGEKLLPLVVNVHGGPTGAYGHRFYLSQAHLFASNGYAVFLPNPRGSTGRGLEFAEANIGDMGGKDFKDIMAGVDHCIGLGIVDPNRLYIMGGSYGGFMTAWAVTQTDRFRAAIMLFGIANWLSFHGKTNVPSWDVIHYNADPYEANGIYRKFSPISYIKNVKTPTLIMHGEEDEIVPVSQGYEFFRGLKDTGVETELVLYPREGHGFQEKKHIVDAMNRYLDWFNRHK
jgi:dipeptidyl aminopeptidase/acylaminoacyl peptidase